MEELKTIMEKFAASGWDLISVPAIKQADKECGSCGCNLDPLYKRVLELL